ncbi:MULTISPECIES: DUF2871 domain-containing protein [Mammaliicoccus]|uniref:DUF2871 domain-containing protein n=1 Tax=Mammaliicoccus fleurettii TaxID=150056 RepID=A0ABS5MNS8_9STAP|nr:MULTISPECIES: DUF2871 domain-containing protein [Mammaliicoccus]MBL0847902.1 DUF2871 domain-containing protein [Mammaliicoccus fleurettii]MBS3671965.1 DUF2871 domain-containing protein [Mammaliicoccus fleurettii]MBS3697580.1 DUF2871 domain-containing protein [Mammaliicoccus fleurettii]MBW0764063.1 DUF2871 domain-containing protein [Mammaliicoccus fleurettii]RIL52851.1 DUF2871 domain-containing protein [Mammaliicoccus fleurettii]
MKRLFYSSAIYTALGLLSGLFYREMSRANDFEGYSQLNVTHTHMLVLGTIMFLVFLLIEKNFSLTRNHKLFNWFFITYHVGLLLTVAMQMTNGIMTLKGIEASPAIAGMSGLGHIFLSVAFILFYVLLNKSYEFKKH